MPQKKLAFSCKKDICSLHYYQILRSTLLKTRKDSMRNFDRKSPLNVISFPFLIALETGASKASLVVTSLSTTLLSPRDFYERFCDK